MIQQSNNINLENDELTTQPSIVEVNDKRTKHAYDFIKKSLGKSHEKDLRSLVRGFPAMIQNNGLCAAIAFLPAKKKAHHKELRETIQDWLIHRKLISLNESNDKKEPTDLVEAIINLKNRDQYRMVSGEVMIYMQWVKRFAEGMLSEDEPESK